MNYILFDDKTWNNLLPLTFTRPVAALRIGILTIKEKWEKLLNNSCSYLTQEYLSEKYKLVKDKENILINASVLPNKEIIKELLSLKLSQALVKNDVLIAVRLSENDVYNFAHSNISEFDIVNSKNIFLKINYPWDIFTKNQQAIISDFELITNNRKSEPLSKTNNVLKKEDIFIEKGAKVEFATLNASTGPIYIGKDAEIMEGSVIRGPFALCEHSVLKLSAKIYGPTTIGPYSKVGGEINNSVIFGYSNKAHDGFLGNSIIGEWCNIGAGSNNSNLKNNYDNVRVWNYEKERFIETGLQFCGLIMGDHSKCAINTMFNTGTVVGVNTNIFGAGFHRNFVPSFSWGGKNRYITYSLDDAFKVAEIVMKRRDKDFDETEKKILTKVFQLTEKYRKF